MANNNSQAKIDLARKHFQAAREAMVLQRSNIADYDKMNAAFDKLAPRLLDENVQTADLDPVFALAKDVSTIAKLAEANAKRASQEISLKRKYETASGVLARWSGKMPAALATSLTERMKDVALDCAEPAQVRDLQLLFRLCDQVFAAGNTAQNDDVVEKVNKALDGWLINKSTGTPARYAEMFLKTSASELVVAWKASKPTSNANSQALKAWRQAGYDLRNGALDHPWGMCSTCGKVKLMPITPKEAGKKTFVPSDCHDCYSGNPKDAKADRPASGGAALTPEAIQELTMNPDNRRVNVYLKNDTIVGGSQVYEMDGFLSEDEVRSGKQVVRPSDDEIEAQAEEPIQIEKIGGKRPARVRKGKK